MVCPLRFVLAGLSAAIVLFLAVDMLWLQSKEDIHGIEVRNLYHLRGSAAHHVSCIRPCSFSTGCAPSGTSKSYFSALHTLSLGKHVFATL